MLKIQRIFNCFLITVLICLAAVGVTASVSEAGLPEASEEGAGVSANVDMAVVPLAPAQPDDNLPGSKQFSYLFVNGNGFIPRSSSVSITYGNSGCIYLGATAGFVVSRLDLPQDSEIKYARFFYNVTDPAGTITSWVTSYSPMLLSYTDLVAVSSPSGGPGIGSFLSGMMSHVVDNYTNNYLLLASLPVNSAVRFCGIRVAYYPPPYLIIQ